MTGIRQTLLERLTIVKTKKTLSSTHNMGTQSFTAPAFLGGKKGASLQVSCYTALLVELCNYRCFRLIIRVQISLCCALIRI